jgi:hypothetical protein
MQDMELEPEPAGSRRHVSRFGLSIGPGRVDEQGNAGCRGEEFMQQL